MVDLAGVIVLVALVFISSFVSLYLDRKVPKKEKKEDYSE